VTDFPLEMFVHVEQTTISKVVCLTDTCCKEAPLQL